MKELRKPVMLGFMDNGRRILTQYDNLIHTINRAVETSFGHFHPHLKCRAGCSLCCVRVNVLPVEWFIIHRKLSGPGCPRGGPESPGADPESPADGEPQIADNERCGFLVDGLCSIYAFRPVICRMHGVPLRYAVEEYDLQGKRKTGGPVEFRITWCDENFQELTDKESETLEKSPFILPAHEWLDTLRQLNGEFLALRPLGEWNGRPVVDICTG